MRRWVSLLCLVVPLSLVSQSVSVLAEGSARLKLSGYLPEPAGGSPDDTINKVHLPILAEDDITQVRPDGGGAYIKSARFDVAGIDSDFGTGEGISIEYYEEKMKRKKYILPRIQDIHIRPQPSAEPSVTAAEPFARVPEGNLSLWRGFLENLHELLFPDDDLF